MSLARWLNTAARFLRLYIGRQSPDKDLKEMVNYIMKVYVPTWFRIKRFKNCFDGIKHVYFLNTSARYLKPALQTVIYKTVQKNAYFAHSENILIAMLHDSDENIRKLAVEKIINIRSENSIDNHVRKFKVPKLNFQASNYYSLITWENATEPPLTKRLSNAELADFISNHDVKKAEYKFPCHTQVYFHIIFLLSFKYH